MARKEYIVSLAELTNLLNESEPDKVNYEQLLSHISFNFRDIEHLCFWDADHYSRINIAVGKNYRLDLICWEKEQQSPIHNHSKDKSWFYILKGELTEKLYKPINGSGHYNFEGEKKLNPKGISHLNHGGSIYHELVNSNSGRSVSLHLYVK